MKRRRTTLLGAGLAVALAATLIGGSVAGSAAAVECTTAGPALTWAMPAAPIVTVPDATAPQNPPGLPALGFSLNGAALAGPIQPAHYAELGSFTPAPVWARIGFSSDGNWRVKVDRYVDALRAAGMKILLRASFPASEHASPSGTVDAIRYGKFVEDLANHVKAKGLGPDDVVFEYPNEINSTRISATTYAAAAKAAYPRLKAVDPGYRIIGGSENVYAANWKSWLDALLAAGFQDAADGISFHNYDMAGDHQRYTHLRQLLDRYQWADAMVWLTEFGASTPPNPSGRALGGQTPDNQAVRLAASLRDIGTNLPWITHAFVYADVDIPSRQRSDPFEANFGIYTNNAAGQIRPKPAVAAIQALYAEK